MSERRAFGVHAVRSNQTSPFPKPCGSCRHLREFERRSLSGDGVGLHAVSPRGRLSPLEEKIKKVSLCRILALPVALIGHMKNKKTDIHISLPYLFSDQNFEFESPKQKGSRLEKFANFGGQIKIDKEAIQLIDPDSAATVDPDSGAKIAPEDPYLLSPEKAAAFEAAYDENHEKIKGWLLKDKKGLVNNIQDAENVAQRLWLYVLRKYKVSDMGVKTMLYRKAGLLAIDYARSRDRKKESLFSDLSHDDEDGGKEFSPENIASENSNPFEFRPEDFWADYPDIALSDAQKEVVWLYGHEGLSFMEIKEITGVAHSTAQGWVKKSRELFKASMKAVS